MVIEEIADIIKKINKGDLKAFNEIILKFQNQIFNFVLKMVYNHEDAMDITQDVFFKAYKNIRFFSFRSKFSTWLYRIAFNHALNFIKKNKRQKTADDKLPDENCFYADDRNMNIEDKEIYNIVENIIGKLNPAYRSCIYLFYNEELSYEEISEVMKIPLNTVRSHLKRGRETIRDILIDKYQIRGLNE